MPVKPTAGLPWASTNDVIEYAKGSTLRRIIAALGGQLELVAHLPIGTVRLTQFDDDLRAVLR